MARARGSTPFGAVLDATCDRLVDGALFAAIAWWAFAVEGNERIAVAALISLVLAQVISYVKARAEASGFTSADGGLVERAERLIIALVGTGLQGLGVSFAVEVSQWLLVALSAITFLQRIVGVAHSAREPRSCVASRDASSTPVTPPAGDWCPNCPRRRQASPSERRPISSPAAAGAAPRSCGPTFAGASRRRARPNSASRPAGRCTPAPATGTKRSLCPALS